jgi:hypothetical protein
MLRGRSRVRCDDEAARSDMEGVRAGRILVLTIGLSGCADEAKPDLNRCVNLESRGLHDEAIQACEEARQKNATSEAGKAATSELAMIRELKAVETRRLQVAESAAADAKRVATEPPQEKAGRWAYLPLPGDDGAARTRYMADAVAAHEGEPPLKHKPAAALMAKVRLALARAAGIPAENIKATVGDASGFLKVTDGVTAALTSNGKVLDGGVCSEVFLGTALADIIGDEPAVAAGLRGLICQSSGCSGVFDLRPNRPPGGGVYGGQLCMSLASMMEMAGIK